MGTGSKPKQCRCSEQTFQEQEKAYLKAKIEELESNSMIKKY